MEHKQTPIMIVEDDATISELLTEFINEHPQLKRLGARPFNNYTNAEDYLKNPEDDEIIPSLIILNLRLGLHDGTQLLEQVRQDPRYDQTRILICSASIGNQELQNNLIKKGAQDCLTKPFDLDNLEDKLLKNTPQQYTYGTHN